MNSKDMKKITMDKNSIVLINGSILAMRIIQSNNTLQNTRIKSKEMSRAA